MDKTQTQTTYFLPRRQVLGAVMICKRVMLAITLGSLFEGNPYLTAVLVGIREALSAYTEFAQSRNPVQSVAQSSPPTPPEQMPNAKATNADADDHNSIN